LFIGKLDKMAKKKSRREKKRLAVKIINIDKQSVNLTERQNEKCKKKLISET